MGFFSNIFGSIACPEFDDLIQNHKEALMNWLNGGYRPRSVMPKQDREIFREYDKQWNYIHENSGRGINPECMSIAQKQFCAQYRSEILKLFSIYSKWKNDVHSIYYLTSYFPFGINAVTIKYLNIALKKYYIPINASALGKRYIKPQIGLSSLFSSFVCYQTVYDIDDLTADQIIEITRHCGEIRDAHIKYQEESNNRQVAEETIRRQMEAERQRSEDEYFKKLQRRKEEEKEKALYQQNYALTEKKVENYYGAQLNETLANRDMTLPILAIGLDNPTAIGNRAVLKFSKSCRDEDIAWRFSIHYLPYFIDVLGKSNSEIRAIAIRVMTRHFMKG